MGPKLAHSRFLSWDFKFWVNISERWEINSTSKFYGRTGKMMAPWAFGDSEETKLSASCIPSLLAQFALWSCDLSPWPSKRSSLSFFFFLKFFVVSMFSVTFGHLCLIYLHWVFSYIHKFLIWPIPTQSSGFCLDVTSERSLSWSYLPEITISVLCISVSPVTSSSFLRLRVLENIGIKTEFFFPFRNFLPSSW